jgi:hypothetical protein
MHKKARNALGCAIVALVLLASATSGAIGSAGIGAHCKLQSGAVTTSGEVIYSAAAGTVIVCALSPRNGFTYSALKATYLDNDGSANITFRFMKKDIFAHPGLTEACSTTSTSLSSSWRTIHIATCTPGVASKNKFIYYVEVTFGSASSLHGLWTYGISEL